MLSEFVLILSFCLIGVGLAGALFRRNLLIVVLNCASCGLGVFTLVAFISASKGISSPTDPSNLEGIVFGFCAIIVVLLNVIIGCSLAYRRFMASGVKNISEGNQLRN